MSTPLLRELIERRAKTWEQAKAHLDAVEASGDDLTGEAHETWQRLNAEIESLDARIAELDAAERRNREAAEVRARYEDVARPAEADQRADDPPSDLDIIRRMVAGEVRAHEFRDLTVGTATAGGNTVPTSFLRQLREHMIENSAIRRTNVTVIETDGGESLQIPKTTTHPTASLIAEGAAISESDPAFGQVTLGAYKYGFSVQVSTELEQDSGVDLAGYLARRGGEALGNGSGAHFVTGTGTGQPRGVMTAATGITGGTGQSGVPTADELVDLYYSVIEPYRRRGYWLMSDITARDVRKLKDSNGQYLWAPGLMAGEPSTLLGRPVVTDTNVADAGLSAESIAFGDFSAYYIRDVRGVRVERSVDFAFQNDLVTWRFLFRTDGDLVDETGAIKTYTGAAT